MKQHLALVFAAVVAVSIASAALLISTASAAGSMPVAAAPAALAVTRSMAVAQRWPETLNAVGSIAAWQEVVIGAEIGGLRLSRLLVDAGDRVTRGQLLAELSPGTLKTDLDASRAALEEAGIAAEAAHRAAGRARALKGTEALSAQDIDQAVVAAETAQARLAAARVDAQANALRLGYTQVRAPDDGVISARLAVQGALIPSGAELMRLQRHGRLEWRAELPGPELARVAPGQAVRLQLGAARVVEGRVRAVSPQVDPQSRAGIVHVDLRPDAALRAGLFARGELLLGERTVVTVPESAVLLRDGFGHVFLVEGSKVRRRKVTLGARRGDRVEIREGLAAGSEVVDSGVDFLADGATVRLAQGQARRAGSIDTLKEAP